MPGAPLATHPTHVALVTALVVGACYAAWYASACWQSPFADCRRCDGHGRLTHTSRAARTRADGRTRRPRGRVCPRCHGGRRRVRLGRRLYEYLRREYTAGQIDSDAADRAELGAGRGDRADRADRAGRGAR